MTTTLDLTPDRIAEIRADERRRCIAELRAYSQKRMNEAVDKVTAGDDAGFVAVSHAAAVGRAAQLLESGELSTPTPAAREVTVR
jgi:hypothetical protein